MIRRPAQPVDDSAGTGIATRSLVPLPCAHSTSIVPPSASTRSLRPIRPEPRLGSAPPTPSSRIERRSFARRELGRDQDRARGRGRTPVIVPFEMPQDAAAHVPDVRRAPAEVLRFRRFQRRDELLEHVRDHDRRGAALGVDALAHGLEPRLVLQEQEVGVEHAQPRILGIAGQTLSQRLDLVAAPADVLTMSGTLIVEEALQ